MVHLSHTLPLLAALILNRQTADGFYSWPFRFRSITQGQSGWGLQMHSYLDSLNPEHSIDSSGKESVDKDHSRLSSQPPKFSDKTLARDEWARSVFGNMHRQASGDRNGKDGQKEDVSTLKQEAAKGKDTERNKVVADSLPKRPPEPTKKGQSNFKSLSPPIPGEKKKDDDWARSVFGNFRRPASDVGLGKDNEKERMSQDKKEAVNKNDSGSSTTVAESSYEKPSQLQDLSSPRTKSPQIPTTKKEKDENEWARSVFSNLRRPISSDGIGNDQQKKNKTKAIGLKNTEPSTAVADSTFEASPQQLDHVQSSPSAYSPQKPTERTEKNENEWARSVFSNVWRPTSGDVTGKDQQREMVPQLKQKPIEERDTQPSAFVDSSIDMPSQPIDHGQSSVGTHSPQTPVANTGKDENEWARSVFSVSIARDQQKERASQSTIPDEQEHSRFSSVSPQNSGSADEKKREVKAPLNSGENSFGREPGQQTGAYPEFREPPDSDDFWAEMGAFVESLKPNGGADGRINVPTAQDQISDEETLKAKSETYLDSFKSPSSELESLQLGSGIQSSKSQATEDVQSGKLEGRDQSSFNATTPRIHLETKGMESELYFNSKASASSKPTSPQMGNVETSKPRPSSKDEGQDHSYQRTLTPQGSELEETKEMEQPESHLKFVERSSKHSPTPSMGSYLDSLKTESTNDDRMIGSPGGQEHSYLGSLSQQITDSNKGANTEWSPNSKETSFEKKAVPQMRSYLETLKPQPDEVDRIKVQSSQDMSYLSSLSRQMPGSKNQKEKQPTVLSNLDSSEDFSSAKPVPQMGSYLDQGDENDRIKVPNSQHRSDLKSSDESGIRSKGGKQEGRAKKEQVKLSPDALWQRPSKQMNSYLDSGYTRVSDDRPNAPKRQNQSQRSSLKPRVQDAHKNPDKGIVNKRASVMRQESIAAEDAKFDKKAQEPSVLFQQDDKVEPHLKKDVKLTPDTRRQRPPQRMYSYLDSTNTRVTDDSRTEKPWVRDQSFRHTPPQSSALGVKIDVGKKDAPLLRREGIEAKETTKNLSEKEQQGERVPEQLTKEKCSNLRMTAESSSGPKPAQPLQQSYLESLKPPSRVADDNVAKKPEGIHRDQSYLSSLSSPITNTQEPNLSPRVSDDQDDAKVKGNTTFFESVVPKQTEVVEKQKSQEMFLSEKPTSSESSMRVESSSSPKPEQSIQQSYLETLKPQPVGDSVQITDGLNPDQSCLSSLSSQRPDSYGASEKQPWAQSYLGSLSPQAYAKVSSKGRMGNDVSLRRKESVESMGGHLGQPEEKLPDHSSLPIEDSSRQKPLQPIGVQQSYLESLKSQSIDADSGSAKKPKGIDEDQSVPSNLSSQSADSYKAKEKQAFGQSYLSNLSPLASEDQEELGEKIASLKQEGVEEENTIKDLKLGKQQDQEVPYETEVKPGHFGSGRNIAVGGSSKKLAQPISQLYLDSLQPHSSNADKGIAKKPTHLDFDHSYLSSLTNPEETATGQDQKFFNSPSPKFSYGGKTDKEPETQSYLDSLKRDASSGEKMEDLEKPKLVEEKPEGATDTSSEPLVKKEEQELPTLDYDYSLGFSLYEKPVKEIASEPTISSAVGEEMDEEPKKKGAQGVGQKEEWRVDDEPQMAEAEESLFVGPEADIEPKCENAPDIESLLSRASEESTLLEIAKKIQEDGPREDMTMEEKIAASIASAQTLGSSIKTYVSVRESLRESKARTQRRLSRSASEKEKAREKVEYLKAKAEADLRRVESELQNKLDEAQALIDEEVERISSLLQTDIAVEAERETQILSLMKSLADAIEQKEGELKHEVMVVTEMLEVRSKLKTGQISNQLDSLIQHKKEVIDAEKTLIDDLFPYLKELNLLLEDGRSRVSRLEEANLKFIHPDSRSDAPYEWTDIEELDRILEDAADTAAASEKRIRELSEKAFEALAKERNLFGESIPAHLVSGASKVASKGTVQQLLAATELEAELFKDMQSRETGELVHIAAGSLGQTAVGASKLVMFGMKALFDSLTGQSVSEAAKEIVNQSFRVSARNNSDVTDLVKKETPSINDMLREKAQSTAYVLGSLGKAGQALVGGIGRSDSTNKANSALVEASGGLVSTANALAVLSLKLVDQGKKKIIDEFIADAIEQKKARDLMEEKLLNEASGKRIGDDPDGVYGQIR